MKRFLNLLRNYSIGFLFLSFVREFKRKIWREYILGSYAQDYEDIKIETLFPKNYKGRYIEIGAYHPTRLSNTYRFYKNGWRGLVIEPNPDVKNLFNKIRPGDRYLGMGISDENKKLTYYQFLIPALNTFSKQEARKNINNGHKLNKTLDIATKKISEVVTENFDILSIDTEGFDEKILKSWPWKKYKPKVICVETDKKSFIDFLEKKGYRKRYQNQTNTIYEKTLS